LLKINSIVYYYYTICRSKSIFCCFAMTPAIKRHFFRFITLDVLISFNFLYVKKNSLLIEPLFYFLMIRPILQEFLSVDWITYLLPKVVELSLYIATPFYHIIVFVFFVLSSEILLLRSVTPHIIRLFTFIFLLLLLIYFLLSKNGQVTS
jgi:hypothetical protein